MTGTHDVVASDRHKPFDRTNLKVNREFGVNGALSALIAAGGTGYTIGDDLTLVGGTFVTAAIFNVDAVAALSAIVAAGGTGYTVSDQITLVGGTGTLAVFNVDAVTGGVIDTVSLVSGGSYTVLPGNPVSVTGGTGTGATLTVTFGVVDVVSVVNKGDYSVTPGNPVSVTGGTGGDDATLTVTFVDELDELKFEGWALPGTSDADSGWQLSQFTVDSQSPPNILSKKYAQNIGKETNGFIFVWNDRATFTYGA